MQVAVQPFTVHKRFALTISRGTTAKTTNIWVRLSQDGIEGWGEASPFSIVGKECKSTDDLLRELKQITPKLEKYPPWDGQVIEEVLRESQTSSAVQASIDMARHDWVGKRTGLSLWRLWGLDCRRIVATSLTVGISTPEEAKQRVRDWQQLIGAPRLKVKLGNREGIAADQAMLKAVREVAPIAELYVDANGGWNLEEAVVMCNCLAGLGVKYVEQPLAVGEEEHLAELSTRSPLPIFADESCWTSRDIPQLAHSVHGINIKIMKAGGLTEAMRMVHTAKAWGLQVMYGCYSDSTLANTAMTQLSPLADYLDLDSHLNLVDDPFTGAVLGSGRLLPTELPGLGVEFSR
ncbi:MAG: dipeptide epimerase [Cyanobacteria bacterium QS_7_48_42]|jgi:L-alanine-DL-glutamate epimerase-like enolase superfamily enzyme|nr:MAG: dipeptide epimerase [Cyanobacteria bacterium QH_10_48_56]PSO62885.1 MAG: dipeptide epimerase [Cyanobacteria bacterium QH_2_48_84]PSO76880.1 MAG: dipeptide epimerase [Cyanobacteria bacterium QH_3_48_40]PSO78584.1 MAG: dipeptide epimerase [Cyanobacteria bacterium QS_4_48_99]PSO80778.1 MAG: dipeptide epimerase [Cyanobacteria bacterium QS_5_48_63]PSO92754.1 MAG: dipeptide epimerase [Cyanobacteria bacterium QS_6_48_18]PSO96328.1 MAG: dipeptide epimerase [Cyanobacteria bacterium QS_9_48_30]